MRDTGKELFFQGVLGNGKLFNFCAFNNDRNYIVSLLNSDLNKDEVKYIMNIYINRCYEDAKKTEPELESLFANAHIMEGIREEVAQAKKQQARNIRPSCAALIQKKTATNKPTKDMQQ